MTTLFVLLAGVLATLANSSGSNNFQEEFHQTYALDAQGRVALENMNGDVRIVAWDRNEVRVDAVTRADSHERLDGAGVVVDATPCSVTIHARHPEQDDSEHPASVDFTVMVPRGAHLDHVKLMNGMLEIAGMKGAVRASSVNGTIRTRNLSGDVHLATVSGRLEAAFENLDASKSIYMNSVNGPIEVLLPLNARADLRADTVSGDISNDCALPRERGRVAGRHLRAAIKGGGTHIRVSNVNGPISLAPAWHGKRVKFT
jgi:DUF4097 and DUF4098 domain-containing protein YvlB